MINLKVKIDTSALNVKLTRQQKELALLPQQGLVEFKKLTPKRTGYARANTQLTNNKVIVSDYAYAKPLDKGTSRQAPKGMVAPFTLWWNKQLRRIFRK
jgi:hypothetical protein